MSRHNSSSNNTTQSIIVSPIETNEALKQYKKRWQDILVKLWIMTSASYASTQRMEEAHQALLEADGLTFGLSADVWHRLGKNNLHEGNGDMKVALDAFKRALSIDPEHIATHISLSSVYLNMHQFELAEQLLERSTKGLGWNETESW